MPSSDGSSGRDPLDRLTEPAHPSDAAGYIIEMLASMAHFAHISDLQNSSAMLSAAASVVEQECRLRTDGPPSFNTEAAIEWPFPFNNEG